MSGAENADSSPEPDRTEGRKGANGVYDEIGLSTPDMIGGYPLLIPSIGDDNSFLLGIKLLARDSSLSKDVISKNFSIEGYVALLNGMAQHVEKAFEVILSKKLKIDLLVLKRSTIKDALEES